MQTKQHSSKKVKSLFLQQDSKKSLILGSIIATLLAIVPFLFTLYESVPNTRVWNTFLFSFDSGAWDSAQYVMWICTGKAVPLMLLIVWFFTNRHWWYHALLVPIVMYIYQIVSLFNDSNQFVDEMQFVYMLPVIAIIIPSIYLIRARIFNKVNNVSKSMEELEDEMKISPKNFWEKVKQYF